MKLILLKIFFHINFANFALILINTSVDYNIKINLIKFFYLFYVHNFSLNNNINLFCNINNNLMFNNKIFL